MRFDSVFHRSLPLALALIMGVCGVATVAYHVWHNQYKTVRTSLINEQRQAINLLAADLNAEISKVVEQSLRYLFEADMALLPARVDAMKLRIPSLQQVMRFDDDGGMLYCIPGPSVLDDYRRWLSAELHQEVSSRSPDDLSTGSFLEEIDSEQLLFTFAPIPDDLHQGDSPGWIVLRFSLRGLLDSHWMPLKDSFLSNNNGLLDLNLTSDLINADATVVTQVPIARYLRGWVLAYTADTDQLNIVAKEQGLLLAFLILGIGSLPIAIGTLYWWHSRRHFLLAQAKTEFVAHISHELKTPLALIRLYAETLELDRIKTPEQKQQYLRTILQESDRLDRLIDQVLDYSRMERGEFRFDVKPDNLKTTIQNFIGVVRPHVEQQGFTLTCDMSEDVQLISHDADAIRHILQNLIDNSIKYSTGDRHSIHVLVSRLQDSIEIQVLDRGKGFSRKVDASILQAFVRGQDENEEHSKGAGLGLAIVKHAVDAHKGEFELTSREGGGAVARINLPIIESKGVAA